MNMEKCSAHPFYEFRKGIYEIDEFCCVSVFLIEGTEKALVIDAGVGIGDLNKVIHRIADKPIEAVASHNHLDHIGGAYNFSEMWMHPLDIDPKRVKENSDVAARRDYANLITKREGKWFPYDLQKDIMEWPTQCTFKPLEDGHVFDLGGRKVTAWHCPGHTPGELVFIDDLTHTLIVGDAVNCNWYLDQNIAETPKAAIQKATNALKRISSFSDQYDYVINSHHDYRGFGNPLNPDVLPNLTTCLEKLSEGNAEFREVKDPMSKNGGTRVSAVEGDVQVSTFGVGIDQLLK